MSDLEIENYARIVKRQKQDFMDSAGADPAIRIKILYNYISSLRVYDNFRNIKVNEFKYAKIAQKITDLDREFDYELSKYRLPDTRGDALIQKYRKKFAQCIRECEFALDFTVDTVQK